MDDRSTPGSAGRSPLGSRLKAVLLEAALVAGCGAALAFAANSLSPRGLSLTRDNFPSRPGNGTLVVGTNALNNGAATNGAASNGALTGRLRAEGLRLARGDEVLQLFQDPRCAQELIIFIDARDDAAYQTGHIPGAYQFDRYYPEKYIQTMLQVCGPAQQVVLYCNGGNCEDSEFAAIMLGQWGIPKEKLLVYGGGITEWTNQRRPLELGSRHSGQMRQY